MIIVVTGSRDWKRRDMINDALKNLKPSLVFHGGARGADTYAGQWCDDNAVDCIVVPALWSGHGKQAGPLRNKRMLELATMLAAPLQTDIAVAAFPMPESIGTNHCIRQAQKMRITVHVWNQTGKKETFSIGKSD